MKNSLFVLLLCASLAPGQEDLFRREVAPILQKRCLSCHNEAEKKGDFSLQTAKSALADGFIEAGDAAGSHLMEMITPKNGKAKMPKDADPLSQAERTVIQRWIDGGASWPKAYRLKEHQITDFSWWSFQPLKRPAVPKIDNGPVGNPIDAFIIRKLEQKGLRRSSQADRRTLIRRLTYDLIGLPPTPEEVQAFVEDKDPKAYEKLVERLLESKHYGERWARHWLDVVKYADTCGYDKDKLRPNAWPYRDYVIRSFNKDKPYARFVQEQIAGDVLFPGEPDGILALGFIASGPWDFIGHVEVPESKIDGRVARNLDRDDMVSNTLNTFCSVTVQCARCHNHKFDPFTQEHYYGLQAIFAAVDRAERPYDTDPQKLRQRLALEAKVSEQRKALAAHDLKIQKAGGPRLAELNKIIAELGAKSKVRKSPAYGYHSQLVKAPDVKKWVMVDLGTEADVEKIMLYPCHDEFAGIGGGFGFPVRFLIEVSGDGKNWMTVASENESDFPNPKLTPYETKKLKQKARYIRVTGTKLVERQNDYMLALAELRALDSSGKNLAKDAKVTAIDSIEAPIRWTTKNLTDGRWPQAASAPEAARLAKATNERGKILAKLLTPEHVRKREALQKELAASEKQLKALPKSDKVVYAAATHFSSQGNFKPTMGKPRSIHVLHRGDILKPKATATPGVLPLSSKAEYQFKDAQDEGSRRAALAKWLTDRDHPLVWRSIVNRIWQYHFGQGIVATPNDFGRMGAPPTHPELLDWLAVEFRDGGQSFKKMHRLIVTSQVYQQSSAHDDEMAKIDGGNQFLWRMNRRRLTAEEIRDSILAVSGTLNSDMGGPGFYLFKLEKTAHSPHYEYHKFDPGDPKSHRRSIYRFIVRSQPDPWMTTLDCADSSQSTPKRNETLTSLQALSLLNNKFNLVMAERFAKRLEKDGKDTASRVERAMQLAAQRLPSDQERQDLVAFTDQFGTANLCRFLFNLSEFVFVD